MSIDDATQAPGTPLSYVNGRPGDEVFLAARNARASGLFVNKDQLYLQFRQGRLAGWKGDWAITDVAIVLRAAVALRATMLRNDQFSTYSSLREFL